MRISRSNGLRWVWLVAGFVLVTGCGNKGNLYLPGQKTPNQGSPIQKNIQKQLPAPEEKDKKNQEQREDVLPAATGR